MTPKESGESLENEATTADLWRDSEYGGNAQNLTGTAEREGGISPVEDDLLAAIN